MDNTINDTRAIRVLISNLLLRAAKLIFQLFLNIFIWKETGDIKLLALFNMIFLMTHTITMAWVSKIVKNGYRNQIHIWSLIGYGLTYLSVVFLKEQVINYILLIGFFIGLFNGLYWSVYHINRYELTHFHNRGNYEGLSHVGDKTVKIALPSIIGIIIGYNYLGVGYEIAFGIGSLFLFLSAFTGRVDLKITDKHKYNLLGTYKKIIKNKNIATSFYTYSLTAGGHTVREIIIPIILLAYVGQEAGVGFLVSVFAITSIIASYIFGKFVAYKYYGISILLSGFLYILGLLGFIHGDQLTSLILLSAFINFTHVFFAIPQNVMSANILHEFKEHKAIRSEYIVLREIFLTIGWMLSYIFMYFSGGFEIDLIKYVFYFLIVVTLISTITLSRINIHKEQ